MDQKLYSNNSGGLFVDLTNENLEKTAQNNENSCKRMAAIRVKQIHRLKSWNFWVETAMFITWHSK